MLNQFVRQLGLFSLSRGNIRPFQHTATIRWTSSHEEKPLPPIDAHLRRVENELGISDRKTLQDEMQQILNSKNNFIKKLDINDTWFDIYNYGEKSLEFLDREYKKELAGTLNDIIGTFSTFLRHAEEICKDGNQKFIIEKILEDDRNPRHYPGDGELRNSLYNWDDKIARLYKNNQFEGINLLEPASEKEIAIHNLFVVVRKFLRDVYKNEEASKLVAWPLNNEEINIRKFSFKK